MMNQNVWNSAPGTVTNGNMGPPPPGQIIDPHTIQQQVSNPLSPVFPATNQMAYMSLQHPQANPTLSQSQVTTTQIVGNSTLPHGPQLPLQSQPMVPTTLDLMSARLQNSNILPNNNSPLSPLGQSVFYGQNFISPTSPHVGTLTHNHGLYNTNTVPHPHYNTTGYPTNHQLLQHHHHQQQQQHHPQMFHQQQQFQQINQNNQQQIVNFQTVQPQLNNMTMNTSTIPQNVVNSTFTETDITSSQFANPNCNPNVNTLPHSLPMTLNPSLQTKAFRNCLNSSTGSDSPVSTPTSPHDSWESYQGEVNTSGSSHYSPTSPRLTEMVVPRYDAPADKEQCLRCSLKVYVMEKVGPIRDVLYHKNCFTCVACGSKLSLKNFHHNPNDMDDYNVFCASHKPRILNLASEGNAVYLAKSMASPRTDKIMEQMTGLETGMQDKSTSGSNSVGKDQQPYSIPSESVTSDRKDRDGSTSSTMDSTSSLTTATAKDADQVDASQTPLSNTPQSSRSYPSNSGSSPFSSVSSSSSYATSLKTEADLDIKSNRDHELDSLTELRLDRPSSRSSGSTVSSTEITKSKADSIDPQNDGDVNGKDGISADKISLASNSSLERPDRPSSFQRSVSTVDPPTSRVLADIKKSSKVLVKSQSSHEFSTLNDLKKSADPRRQLTRNESMRMDRPSQYQV